MMMMVVVEMMMMMVVEMMMMMVVVEMMMMMMVVVEMMMMMVVEMMMMVVVVMMTMSTCLTEDGIEGINGRKVKEDMFVGKRFRFVDLTQWSVTVVNVIQVYDIKFHVILTFIDDGVQVL